MYDTIRPIIWHEGTLQLLDQRLLPQQVIYNSYTSAEAVATAISEMVVRGAPAIGITAAYGVVLATQQALQGHVADWRQAVAKAIALLAKARPTAVNLAWALAEMEPLVSKVKEHHALEKLLARAVAIHQQDIADNHTMGELGTALIAQGGGANPVGVLTHCNAGALATGGYGTALGVIRSAFAAGKIHQVYADETRPWLQGARLTAWELLQDKIPVTLIAEGAAARLMHQQRVTWVVVGADRIAANGDVANKVGTSGVAIIARHYGVKVMVVAPTSTIDMHTTNGSGIPIEERPASELLDFHGETVAAAGCGAWNPVFDVTPASLIDAIVTEKGVVEQPSYAKLAALMRR
ncbi:MAG: S-methyl-5-thioribose-1-phosphate isomerase [Gammaproteobacteria bacterium]|nr:S-methyl-5-thioribose-1-phosphate isomerase [Gammaproteobacteria bacterium]